MSGNSDIGSEILDFYMNETSFNDTSTLGPFTNGCSWNDKFNEYECNIQPQNSLWIRVLVFFLYGLVCVVGLCGNTLVIYVVLRFSKMQTVTNFYIVNLAIADECFLVGIPFIMTTLVVEYWQFGVIMCKIYFTTTSINQITSSMFLLIMSADRYLAVCHPISATKYRTQLIASIVALTAWSLSALIMTPIFMYTNTLTVMDRVTCNIFWPPGWISGEQTFMMYSVLLGFLVPLLLISVFYVLVILKLQHVGPQRMKLPVGKDGPNALNINQQNRAKDRKKSHRKVTKLVFTVITVYFTCWAPYWVTQIILIFMENQKVHSEFMLTTFLLTGCLSYSNSAMNPILYAFLSDNFKKSFMKACSCANRKDINTAMQNENYPYDKSKKGGSGASNMDKRRGTGTTIASTVGGTGSGAPATCRVVENKPENRCGNPPKIITEVVDDNGFFDSDDEGAAILGRSADYHESAMTSRSAISEASKVTQETSINEEVHVTSL